jgi:hypothetical protein
MANIRICSKCGKIGLDQYDFSFRWYENRGKCYYDAQCIACVNKYKREYSRQHRKDNRNKWVSFIKDAGYDKCSICGYNKCFAALDFHHTNSCTKEFEMSTFVINACNERNKQILLKEISKCIILCANCHRELHYK